MPGFADRLRAGNDQTFGKAVPTPTQSATVSDPAAPAAGGDFNYGSDPRNDQMILDRIKYYATLPGANESLTRDPGYWLKRIKETDGLSAGNDQYWQGLATRPEGAPEGGGAHGTSGGYAGGMPFSLPQVGGMIGAGFGGMTPEQVMQQDPGYGFRLGEGQKAIEHGAAANGTLLTGATQKALQRYAQDYASGEFGNVFNRNFNVANLGLNATGQASLLGQNYANSQGGYLTGNAANQANELTGNANAQGQASLTQGGIWGSLPNNFAQLLNFYNS